MKGSLIIGIALGGVIGAAAAMAVNGDLNAQTIQRLGRRVSSGASRVGIIL